MKSCLRRKEGAKEGKYSEIWLKWQGPPRCEINRCSLSVAPVVSQGSCSHTKSLLWHDVNTLSPFLVVQSHRHLQMLWNVLDSIRKARSTSVPAPADPPKDKTPRGSWEVHSNKQMVNRTWIRKQRSICFCFLYQHCSEWQFVGRQKARPVSSNVSR